MGNRVLLESIVARLLIEEVEAGRWVKLPSGELVPVDEVVPTGNCRPDVVKWRGEEFEEVLGAPEKVAAPAS